MSAKRTIALLAAAGFVVACASYAMAQGEKKPDRVFVASKTETVVLKDKPAPKGSDTATVLYGQRLLKLKEEKGQDGNVWVFVKQTRPPKEGWLPKAFSSPGRPGAFKSGSLLGRGSKTGAGGTASVSTAAVRSLDKRAKEYAKTRAKDDPKRAARVENMVGWLEARVDGSAEDSVKGWFPNRKTREKRAKEFQGGTS